MGKRLKVGIIGCGGIANGKHLPSLKAINRVDLVAFCDLIEEKAQKAAREYGTPDAKVYTDYTELLKDESIDVVHVLTPNRMHAQISIDDFSKVKLVAAQVVECEKVAKSDKLLRLIVDIGSEKRQVVSGIAKFYAPEELVGKKLVLVSNLKPAMLRGVESRGMILCSGEDNVRVVELSPDVPNGTVIR